MTIIAFDVATRTGICWGEGESLPHCTSIDLNAEAVAQQKKRLIGDKLEVGVAFSTARQAFIPLLAEAKPRYVIFEAPILHGTTTVETVRKLQGLAGLVEELAFEFKAQTFEHDIGAIKQMLSGHGRADKPYQVRAAQIMGIDIPVIGRTKDGQPIYDDNAADAFGLWLCAVKQVRPDVFNRVWAPRQDCDAWRANQKAAGDDNKSRLKAKRDKKAGQGGLL